MKQIARVVLENFQSHQRSELTFGPGLNVIVGPSDNGKSAVLRAIRWALYNEPRGSDFVRVGARECRVTVTMSDGAEIVRELVLTKSGAPSRNRYIVTLPGEEPQSFEGFGHDLPAEVTRAHGMPKVLLDADKQVMLCFGTQLEGPFLMAETGSMRAKAIGRLLGVHVVDAALRETQRDLRAVRQEAARQEKELERYEAELQDFADIPEQEERLARAEAVAAQAEALSARLQRLQWLQAELAEVERRAAEAAAQMRKAETQLRSDLSAYGDLLRELGRCPTCLQPVAPEAVDRIVAELSAGGDGHAHGRRDGEGGAGGDGSRSGEATGRAEGAD